jgi:hypothetical protein
MEPFVETFLKTLDLTDSDSRRIISFPWVSETKDLPDPAVEEFLRSLDIANEYHKKIIDFDWPRKYDDILDSIRNDLKKERVKSWINEPRPMCSRKDLLSIAKRFGMQDEFEDQYYIDEKKVTISCTAGPIGRINEYEGPIDWEIESLDSDIERIYLYFDDDEFTPENIDYKDRTACWSEKKLCNFYEPFENDENGRLKRLKSAIEKEQFKKAKDIIDEGPPSGRMMIEVLKNLEILEYALQKGGDPNFGEIECEGIYTSVIDEAMRYGEKEAEKRVDKLLEYGLDINKVYEDGKTVLDRTILLASERRWYSDNVKTLLKRGAKSEIEKH